MAGELWIGTSGWHYPTGPGSWNGVFYPKPRPAGFDELSFYAQFFDVVEINTTFYGPPRVDVVRSWVEKTPKNFQFTVKIYQKMTHPRLFRERVARTLTKQLGTAEIPDDVVTALIAANVADFDEFKRGIDPLANAGKLGPLLAQFPPSFKDDPDARVHLSALLRAFGDYAVAVELRHRSWSDNREQTLDVLKSFGASWVWVDEPKFKDSVQQELSADDVPFLYLRLHGRNAKDWWRGKRDERYDYTYSAEELRPVADALLDARARGKRGYAFGNNHANARSISTAAQMRDLTRQGNPLALPVSMARGE